MIVSTERNEPPDLGVFGAEAPKRAARAVGNDTAVANGAGPTAARPALLPADVPVQAVRRVPGPRGAHPSRIAHPAAAGAVAVAVAVPPFSCSSGEGVGG